MPKASVIIPVYNVEQYLPRCLDSVINQTLEDIEIICINDCSTDGSLAILKEYALKDKRIKLIDFPENRGVSAARNTGIDNANGEYIAFLDPDDWWELDLIEKGLKKIQKENADIVLFCHNEFKDNKITPRKDKSEKIQNVINGDRYTKYLQDFSIFIWDKIYKKELLKDSGVRFVEKIHPTEDVLLSLELLAKNPAIAFLDEYLYNYRLNREGSAMNNYDNLVSNQIKAFKTMLESDFYINSDNKFKIACVNIIFGGVMYFYTLTAKKKFVLKDFLEMRKLIPYMKEKLSTEILENTEGYKYLKDITEVNLKNGVSCLK